ncbi:MAG: ligase-associated DNA damage response exonuclease [Rubrivivax sp.]|nr:ligase-associated DNA damage response exonuclease [Rubrivivax sp.]
MATGLDDLIVQRPEGLYCPAGDFHIDPMRPVARAVITHAHADHARRGHGAYLATAISEAILRARLGAIPLQGLAYGQTLSINGVQLSLHPAGHLLGSAQVRLAHRGRVWVVSGDYFCSAFDGDTNPTCTPFEPVRCDCFVTESTFGLPIYRWRPQAEVMAEINAWWRANAGAGRASLLLGYSLGKAQRLLAGLDPGIGAIVVHQTVEPINSAYRTAGVVLPATLPLAALADPLVSRRALVLAPPTQRSQTSLPPPDACSVAFASGWMQLRSRRRRQGMDRGFVLSDHADWPGLQRAIAATGAGRVIVMHGYEAALVRWLNQQGLQAGHFNADPDGVGADRT